MGEQAGMFFSTIWRCHVVDILSQEQITVLMNIIKQWRIQDFPEGGREHAKFSRKLHEIERIWTPRGGRASLTPPLDPPM